MPIFNFYKFKNKQADGKASLFAEQNAQQAKENMSKYKTPEECFGSFFASSHPIQ